MSLQDEIPSDVEQGLEVVKGEDSDSDSDSDVDGSFEFGGILVRFTLNCFPTNIPTLLPFRLL